jgi:hypothetical protein
VLTNAVVAWTTEYYSRAVLELRSQGRSVPDEVLAHISPGHSDNVSALRRLVSPGGRVLLGEGFWEHPPSSGEIAAMWPGTTAGEYRNLAGLVGLAVSAGFRPEWIETASLQEWDDFESGYMADVEEWLAGHQDHPEAAETRKQADEHLSVWLRGSRGLLGLAYLTLIPQP